jgi:hypothetical protein
MLADIHSSSGWLRVRVAQDLNPGLQPRQLMKRLPWPRPTCHEGTFWPLVSTLLAEIGPTFGPISTDEFFVNCSSGFPPSRLPPL